MNHLDSLKQLDNSRQRRKYALWSPNRQMKPEMASTRRKTPKIQRKRYFMVHFTNWPWNPLQFKCLHGIHLLPTLPTWELISNIYRKYSIIYISHRFVHAHSLNFYISVFCRSFATYLSFFESLLFSLSPSLRSPFAQSNRDSKRILYGALWGIARCYQSEWERERKRPGLRTG